jgi:outer membrane receptor protein involved in Fe transport
MHKIHPRHALGLLALAAILPHLAAQTPAEDQKPADDSNVVKLEKFEVNGVPISQQIMPTARPFNSVFGMDDNIIEVPRNVTIISRQQLSDISINSVVDFTKLTSSSYTKSNFGAPSNPDIRGQPSDVFINGVRGRITSNGNGLPLDFNSVESVNIVKGPATAVQGTSMYVGGFIDLVTKRPYFDTQKGSVSVTVGSYGKQNLTIDVGGPLSKQLAYRISFSDEDSKGYWQDYYNKGQHLYGAVTYRPSDHYEIFVNGSLNHYQYTENWGMNRVTQDLIDNLHYITGININNGASATPSDPQNSVNVLGGGNTIAHGPTVTLNRHTRLLMPGNHSKGDEYNAQVIQTDTVSPDFKVVNNTFWSYTKRNTLSTYYYSEIIDPSWFAENRTEFILTKDKVTVNAGLDLRYQKTKAYDDYFYEPVNVWDLTKDHHYINVYNSTDFAANHGFPVPGWPGRYANPGVWNGDTNDSHATTFGPYVQTTWKLTDKFNLNAGLREDYFSATVRDPLVPYPVPTYKISVTNPNVNGSLVYKATTTSSYYFTYNYSRNTSGALGNGGGITGWNAAASALDKENFTQPSSLYEAGAKFAFDQNKVFFNTALFHQTRTAKTTSGTSIQQFKYTGLEAELNYQPNKHLYSTVSFSYIDAKSTAGFQYGDYSGPTEFFGNEAVVPDSSVVKQPGLPSISANALVSYSFDNGFGVSSDVLYTGEMHQNAAGTIIIPAQYELDASFWYSYKKKWDFRVNVLNVTNQMNWQPSTYYGNGSIVALPGTQVQATIKYSF